jgi:macrolide transport system ATP-binding/permease protein
MARKLPRLLLWLFRGSEAALGDVLEERANGRGTLWAWRQALSVVAPRRHVLITIRKPRDRWTGMLTNLWSDIRYAVRTFRRHPGFTAAAVTPIALGIGINTGMFSILDGLALRSLPAPEAHELVSIHQHLRGVPNRNSHGTDSMFAAPEYRSYRDGTQTLSGLMGYSVPWTVTLGGESPQEVEGALVTCNYFDVLQVRPAIGAGFTPASCDAPGAPPAVILGHDLWTRTFAANLDIVGKTVTLNRRSFVVVGVAPAGFDGIDVLRVTLFVPTSSQPALGPDADADFYRDANTSWLSLVGRRRPGVGMAQVRAELGVIARRIDQHQPGRTTTLTVAQATALSAPEPRRNILSVAAVVLAAFGLVLLIACANVANLLLARAAGRTKEIALRLSLGASRSRLIQQLLTESVIIALAGGAVGSVLAVWSFEGLLAVVLSSLPGSIPPVRIDGHPSVGVFWFAFGLTIATGLVFGLAPALQASTQDLLTAMKQDAAGSGRRTAGWLRGMLVGVQVLVCTVLLISAGLLLRGLYAAQMVEPGFDYRHVTVASFDLGRSGYDQMRAGTFQRQLLESVRALPGVEAVAQVAWTPLSPGHRRSMFHLPGQEPWLPIDVNDVSPEYFSLIAIPIVRGHTFTSEELGDGSRAVIVTEATARRYWPGADPIGQTIVRRVSPTQEVSLVVVGVAKDAQVLNLGETAASYVYLPATPRVQSRLGLLVRSRIPFAGLAAGIRASARKLDSGLVVQVSRLEENLDVWRTLSRLVATLAGSLSVLALALASVGVYGVVSYVVSRRLREVGIRMMLGATASDVQGMILRQTLCPVVIGVAIGIGVAAGASQILSSVLFGVSRFDPIAFIAAPLCLVGVAAAASLIPARRAMRVDPMTTLRYE